MMKKPLRPPITRPISRIILADPAFWLLVLECLSGGFFVVITRGLTPIYLVSLGFRLRDLLVLNAFAGLIALLASGIVYKTTRPGMVKKKLLIVHALERITWFTILFSASNIWLVVIVYSLAWTMSFMTGIYLNVMLFTGFTGEKYKNVVKYRIVAGSVSSILAQLTMMLVLAMLPSAKKYMILYGLAFLVGLVGTVLVAATPISPIVERPRKAEEEVEIEATNIFILMLSLYVATGLTSIAWVPRLMIDLNTPDYFVALLGFTQTLMSIPASIIWGRMGLRTYRYAVIGLSITPLLILVTLIPYLHIGIAALYSFSYVGTSLFSGLAYSTIVKKLGVTRASIFLINANASAMVISGALGFIIPTPFLVFIIASAFAILGLLVALTSIPELAVVPPIYVRMYSRIIYVSSIASYNLLVLTTLETTKMVLRLLGLVMSLILLFMIYRILYYIYILTGG